MRMMYRYYVVNSFNICNLKTPKFYTLYSIGGNVRTHAVSYFLEQRMKKCENMAEYAEVMLFIQFYRNNVRAWIFISNTPH